VPDVRSQLATAIGTLTAAGVGSPRVDAELLLADVLDVSRSLLALSPSLTDEQLRVFAGLVARRALREPLQHILGVAPFRFLELEVGPGVFVPRPETELLVDAVLPALTELARPVVVDLCAGSGALALSIASEVPDAEVVAVELDPGALYWLQRNAANLAGTTGAEIAITEGDVADPELLVGLAGAVDVVLSNPPYVPSATEVEPEVAADPARAVFAGPDGLDLLPAVLSRAARLLRSGGLLAVEHDDTHADSVPALLAAGGLWTQIQLHHDLTGRPRFCTAIRNAAPPAETLPPAKAG
jgi:release factor glutamine methyltransferase